MIERYARSPGRGGVPQSTNTGRFRYTGQLWLPDARVYHYKARAYHPGLGRFLQPDPIGYGDGMNLYAYVGGDPVNETDPTGMCPNCVAGAIGVLVGGGAKAYQIYRENPDFSTWGWKEAAAIGGSAAASGLGAATGFGVTAGLIRFAGGAASGGVTQIVGHALAGAAGGSVGGAYAGFVSTYTDAYRSPAPPAVVLRRAAGNATRGAVFGGTFGAVFGARSGAANGQFIRYVSAPNVVTVYRRSHGGSAGAGYEFVQAATSQAGDTIYCDYAGKDEKGQDWLTCLP